MAMKPLRPAAIAGAALLIVGVGAVAATVASHSHTATERMPDGSVVKIWYAGEAPPVVRYGLPPAPGLAPFDQRFAADPAIARLDRIAAALDRQAAAMLQGPAMQRGPVDQAGLAPIDAGDTPAGVRSFSVVSTLTGSGVCTRSVEYDSMGDGKPPKVIAHTSSGCSRRDAAPARSAGPDKPELPPSNLVQASFDNASPGRWR
jgi:hypothetical protein